MLRVFRGGYGKTDFKNIAHSTVQKIDWGETRGDVTELLWHFGEEISGDWTREVGLQTKEVYEPRAIQKVGFKDEAMGCIKGERKM